MQGNPISRRRLMRMTGAAGVVMATARLAPAATPAGKSETERLPSSITAAGQAFRSGRLTSAALTQAYLQCINTFQPKLDAFITVTADQAMATARQLDADLAQGKDRGHFHGIPVVIKDIYDMAGAPTTVGSEAFRHRVTKDNAAAVNKLEAAGAVILGKTNMNEFAAGISGTNAAFGDTHNPWALDRSPGGSSSGTGAALAAGIGLAGTGTDTGGSIRVPASWCGICGIRPTFGLVSLAGVFPRAPSLDTGGPLARQVRDLAYMLDAMAGYDPDYPYTALAQRRLSYAEGIDDGVKGLRIALVRNYSFRDVDAPVAQAIRQAADTFGKLGAEISEISVPPLEGGLDYNNLFNNVLLYEFTQFMAKRYQETPNAEKVFGPIVTNNLKTGSQVSRQTYERLMADRPKVIAQLKDAFRQVDAILTPALPAVAPLLSASANDFDRGREFTIPFSYTNLPCVVVPAGFSPEGLPIGLQLVGDHFEEALLLRMAQAFAEDTRLLDKHPPVYCEGHQEQATGPR
jgi:aspartyl-tRNA(Asn)/glutamyl-tRNA(Gln) amidotransferase subunit A